jgi:DNA-directed RNA polymerase subunit F
MAISVVLKSIFDDKGIKDAQKGFDQLGRSVDKAFKALTVGAGIAAVGLAKFGGDAIKAASDLEESTNAVNVSFLEASEAVLKIGETSAEALGLARTEFNQAAVRFSAFAERVVGEGGDVAGFIGDITTRAADFASVFNIEVAEALQVFQSGLAGEAEPLKRFGINLLQTEVAAYAVANGISESASSMTEAEKVQARYGLLMEQTNKTAGDFANTSEGLANSQRILRARFTDLQAEIGNALLPVVTDLLKAVSDRLLPAFEDLGAFFRSPQGQKAIDDVASSLEAMFDFIADNFDAIVRTTQAVATFVIGLKVFTTVVQGATAAQKLFNLAVKANPYVLAVTALLALVSSMAAFKRDADAGALSAQRKSYQVAILEGEIAQLNDAYRVGAIDQESYDAQLNAMQSTLNSVKISVDQTAGEFNRFNQLRLDGAIASMNAFKAATSFAERQARSFSDSYAYLESIGAVTSRTATSTAGAGVSAGVAAESAFDKVRKFIKDAQKDLRDAQETYTKSVQGARENYAEAVLRTEEAFANRLADIVQQSQNRLRNAFANVVRVSLTDIFTVEETSSVENLVRGLQERLSKSRNLLARAGELNAAGFSQTFIEQVVQAGVDTGNELAKAILDSTPETQRELQGLFTEVEKTADSGMDSLAKTIYDQQGLATQELKNLYATTQDELAQELLDLQVQLQDSLLDAQNDFVDSVQGIREKLKEQLDGMKGDFGGLENTIDQFMRKLDRLEAQVPTPAPAPVAPPIQTPIGPIAAPVITPLPEPVTVAPKQTAPIINVNVKTDTTQSPAMVGSSIAKTISKYTGGGGGLKGISVVAI